MRTSLLRFAASAVVIGLAGMGALFGSGCSGGGSSGPPSVSASSLVGRWRQTGIAISNASVSCPGTLTVDGVGAISCTDSSAIEFRSDGTFTSTSGASSNQSANGTWEVSGNSLTLRTASAIGTPTVQNFSVSLSSGNLKATLKTSGTPYTISYLSVS